MITADQYFAAFPELERNPICSANCNNLLAHVNALLSEMASSGLTMHTNVHRGTPHFGTMISGEGHGGIRPMGCTVGAPNSSHQEGRGIDICDPDGELDNWLNDAKLEEYGLYREAPASTEGWVHLTTRPPHSGLRTFNP